MKECLSCWSSADLFQIIDASAACQHIINLFEPDLLWQHPLFVSRAHFLVCSRMAMIGRTPTSLFPQTSCIVEKK